MGYRSPALILVAALLAVLGSPLPGRAQVPAQATVLALRGARGIGNEAAITFDVRDAQGRGVPGVVQRDVTVRAGGDALQVSALDPAAMTGTVWVLDATRRARPAAFAETQQAFALWADSLRPAREVAAVVAAGRTPRLVQAWTSDRRLLRTAVDNVSPREDEADLPATLRFAAEACASLPVAVVRCAVVFATDARDAGTSTARLDSAAMALAGLGVPVYAALLDAGPREGAASDAFARLVRASGGLTVTDTQADAAVRSLRTRLAEAYVARVTGLPTGRRVGLYVSVRTADGRTLGDSTTVRLAAPPAAAPDSSAGAPAATRAKEGRWKLWLGLLSLLVAGGAAWLFFGRGKKTDPDIEAPGPASTLGNTRAATPSTSGEGAVEGAAVLPAQPVPVPVVHHPPAPSSFEEGEKMPPPVGAQASPPLRLTLQPLRTGAVGVQVSVGERVTLGRALGQADVAVPGDPAISARHVQLERHGNRVLLRDLGSTNGTTVNGVPVRPTVVLDEGDLIRMGDTDLRVKYEQP